MWIGLLWTGWLGRLSFFSGLAFWANCLLFSGLAFWANWLGFLSVDWLIGPIVFCWVDWLIAPIVFTVDWLFGSIVFFSVDWLFAPFVFSRQAGFMHRLFLLLCGRTTGIYIFRGPFTTRVPWRYKCMWEVQILDVFLTFVLLSH